MIIGKFTRTSDGWSGTILTLTIHTKARFVPNDKRENERALDFRVLSGHSELGAAWRRAQQDTDSHERLSVILDDPLMAAPLNVMLLETARPSEASLIWIRQGTSRSGPTQIDNGLDPDFDPDDDISM